MHISEQDKNSHLFTIENWAG